MYRTRQYHIKKNSRLNPYCTELCRKSAALYNRANFLIRQYATAIESFHAMKPLYENQMKVYRLVHDILAGTKYQGDSRWLNYNAVDRVLKVSKDSAYYALPAQANQQVLKLLLRDYRSFFEAIKAYKKSPSAFTGRPRLPGYCKEEGLKTSILTNQICAVKEDKYLKFPGTKTRLNLGLCEGDRKLKEVRIKPAGDRFVIDVVLEVEDCGITPAENDEILKELGKMETIDDLRVIAIDPGTDNIAAVVNNFGDRPFLIKGGIIKSVNQMYNKDLARLSSAAMRCNGRHRTKRMNALTSRRNRRIKDRFHKISRQIADYAKEQHVDVVIMGHNVFQKQKIKIGHVNNQNFVQIPMTIFAGMLEYKLAAYGIRFVTTEESYTSKADFLALDPIPEYKRDDESVHRFSGERIKRGLYRHYDGTVTNADINGAANILRKVFPKVTRWDRGIVDMPCSVGCKDPAGSCREAA
ncbi:MAG: transposase [Lachnospiraceae bacterium]|nr:transposase [Lachnospiraceae bacterium]